MEEILRIEVDVFALLVALVLVFSSRSRNERQFLDYRLFQLMTWAVALELTLDSFMWLFDGSSTAAGRVLLVASTCLYYVFHPVAPLCYALFSLHRISPDARRLRRASIYLVSLWAVSVCLSVASLKTGWYFSVSASGCYSHGPWFGLFAFFSYAYFVIAGCFLFPAWRRKAIDGRTFASLLFFPVMPAIAGILQITFFGLVLLWPAMTLSTLFIYVTLQQRKLSVDYLTGVFNRRRLDEYLGVCTRDRSAPRARTSAFPPASTLLHRGRRRSRRDADRLAGFLSDVDDFKSINDRLGHAAGDAALVDAARILKSSLRATDFLARYAGDEFVAVFHVASPDELRKVVERVRACAEAFCLEGRPYRLSFSVGAALFDPAIDANADRFVERLDRLMYEEKVAKKGKPKSLEPR